MSVTAEPQGASTGTTGTRHYGKYRGLVLDNIDPLQIGRVLAQVPDVFGELPGSWAMPCVPAAGIQAGCFIVPPIGSQVWIEFEQGNPDYPIWSGGFWGLVADVPIFATAPPAIPPGQNIVLQTTGQNSLILSDSVPTPATGGIVLKGASGAMIVVNETGIYISNGQGATITLIGPTVAINMTALQSRGARSHAGTDSARRRGRHVRARRPGDSHRAEHGRVRVRNARCDHRGAVCGRRVRVRSAGRQRPVRHGQWVVGALQVLSHGQPIAIMSGVAVCTPTGTPLLPVSAQMLVLAT